MSQNPMRDEPDADGCVSIGEAVRMAVDYHRTGRLLEANAIYTRILELDPHHAEALHFLGLLHHQLGHASSAIECLRRALATQPDYHDARCNLGNLLRAEGDLEGAEACYREVLRLHPGFVDAWNNLGVLLRQIGQADEAEQAYRQAIAIDPNCPQAHSNLGQLALERGQISEAIRACREVIRLAPELAEAHRNLAQALNADQRHAEAVVASKRALELGALAYEELGTALRNQGLPHEALAAFRQAARIDPETNQSIYGNAVYNLGILLHQTGQSEEAIAVYRDWLDHEPDNPVAAHMLAAWTDAEATPERASDRYVASIFDGFAPDFDRQLAKLEYRAPEVLANSLARCQVEPRAALRVLDAGCGTGLCASVLRPFAAVLTGVDLSLEMLERARARELYDQLIRCELTAFLNDSDRAYDIIVSIDTLVYFGDLGSVIAAANRALVTGGWLLMTLERAPDDTLTGYRLMPTGRYAHTRDYLRTLLLEQGFAAIQVQDDVLRLECGEPVAGLVVTAQRS